MAGYGAERRQRLSLWQPVEEKRQPLQTLVLRRMDLIAMRVAEKNRLQAPQSAPIASSLKTVIRCLERQIAALDKQIEALIEEPQPLKASIDTMRAMPGIGPVVAAGIAALMPELGHMTRRQTAALAGLAPHPKDSGTLKGYRCIRGGRPEVRRLLFRAAMVAARHNPTLREFYKRLIDNGEKTDCRSYRTDAENDRDLKRKNTRQSHHQRELRTT